jgi:hypothetical protein
MTNDEIISAITDAYEKTVKQVYQAINNLVDSLEPYQLYELAHPKKKPRGSIRRNKRR